MKKQLLFVPLVGLLCFTSCNKSRELSPVDDKTGLERATTILAKEEAIIEQMPTNPKAIFDILPKKLSCRLIDTTNGKVRMHTEDTRFPIREETYDNLIEREINFEFDYEKLQLHSSHSNFVGKMLELNAFYDETNGKYYILDYTGGVKTKEVIDAPSREIAETTFLQILNGSDFAEFFGIVFPVSFLGKITTKTEENYNLLTDYATMKKDYFDRYSDGTEYFNYQFGSNDENSFSLKNNFKVKSNDIRLSSIELPIVSQGYIEGSLACSVYNSSNDYFDWLDNYEAYTGGSVYKTPDLLVIKNNYLSYASFLSKVDIESLQQQGMPAGALYSHTTEQTTIEVVNDADITNPNPDDYDSLLFNLR